MSSICGIVDLSSEVFDFERLRDMGRAMVLRGKDQSGAYISGGVGLQHNRMICSGGVKSRQPYTLKKGERAYTIVFDGELYNMDKLCDLFGFERFECAAEAALKAYLALGADCLSHLDGAFAFAVYDEKSKEVFLARDSIGAKPLYYIRNNGVLVFSSEIKGIIRYLSDGVEVDKRALSELIRAPEGMIGTDDVYIGISELPEASFAVHSKLGTQVHRYKKVSHAKSFLERGAPTDILYPSCELPPYDLESQLHEILVAFDRPAFDEYMPGYMAAIKSRAELKRATVCDNALLMDVSYALERADRIGMMNGVMINIIPPEDTPQKKRGALSKTEKRLADMCERILSDKESYIFRYFGNGIKNSACGEKDLRRRLRIYGRIIQTEQWLSSYPILPV